MIMMVADYRGEVHRLQLHPSQSALEGIVRRGLSTVPSCNGDVDSDFDLGGGQGSSPAATGAVASHEYTRFTEGHTGRQLRYRSVDMSRPLKRGIEVPTGGIGPPHT